MVILTNTYGFKLSRRYRTHVTSDRLTCYTCTDKGNNHECHSWAHHKVCPAGYTVCETVHRFHHHSGRSVFVEKRCARLTECTDYIGCQRLHKKHHKYLTECRSCCTESYCNRDVPHNMTTALELSFSSSRTQTKTSAASCDSVWPITALVIVSWAILR